MNSYLMIFGISAGISASAIALMIVTQAAQLWLFLILASVPVGILILQSIYRVVGRQMGEYAGHSAAGGIVLGTVIVGLLTGALENLGLLIYAAIVATLVFGRIRQAV